jgi:hypothetical protein
MLVLGWWAMAALGPDGSDHGDYVPHTYDAASGGILNDPSGYGKDSSFNNSIAGIIGSDDPDELKDGSDVVADPKKPTIKGALAELHHAVSDKLSSYWHPAHGAHVESNTGKNRTSLKAQQDKAAGKHGDEGEMVKDGISEEDRLGARTRVGKCTIVFNGNDYWERAIRTHEQHDQIHGYRLHVLRQSLLDDVWSKPAYILSLILRELAKPQSDRLDWLMWVDADTIILNPYVSIETFLPPPRFDDVHLIYTNDWNGLNNGIFFVRVSRWAVDLFSAILAYRYYRPDAPLVFRDQSAMDALMHEPKFERNIAQAPQRWFNAYQGEHNETLAPFQIRRGDLLVHFAGVPGREDRMGYWLDRAEQHLDDWEIPVKSTSYPQEARDFWSGQRAARKAQEEHMAEVRTKAINLLTETDAKLSIHTMRLTSEQNEAVQKAKEVLKKLVDDEHWQEKLSELEAKTRELMHAAEPLQSVAEQSHKDLLKSAHEAIFAGEKDVFEAGSVDEPDVNVIHDSVSRLKEIVMSPQEGWETATLQNAVDAVTQARARLRDNKAAQIAAADALQKAEEDRAKAIEDARKQVMAEANEAAVGAQMAQEGQTPEAAGVAVAESAAIVVEDPIPMNTPDSAAGAGNAIQLVDGPAAINAPVEDS